ncbi:DUF58 domain-containing protein [Halorhabdus amylolytica]|uniref:DUF58 domain-containing protein n=1 Tax=Halorhabdus amylolytica TaxID=2559573 RepID=UPI0010AA959D|nr:DUF58 domain-containing protein [Halorhabdus amylolytica]
MRLTRRGWATIGAAVIAVLMAWTFGSRALNAVAVTAVIAFAVGAVQLRSVEVPSIERSTPESGFPGETRTISIDVNGTRGTIVRGHDAIPDGLASVGNGFEGTIPVGTTYEVTLTERGRHTIGPATVRQSDALGLMERTDRIEETSILVYPAVYDVAGSETLATVVDRAGTSERQEIDRLREYVPGDPLRDIAWKASAKRLPEFVVVEFAGQGTTGTAELAVTATRERIDDAASAAASVVLFLLDTGLEVGITVPDGRLEPGSGRRHRGEVLRLLAETGSGTIAEHTWADADVRIVGEDDAVTVDTGAHTVAFETVRAGDGTGVPEQSSERDRPDWLEVSAT